MIVNGILVTSDKQDSVIRGSWYRGPCFGRRWPLAFIDGADLNDEIVALNTEVCGHYEPWENSVAVVPDASLIRQYTAACSRRGIGTRILLLSSGLVSPLDSLADLGGLGTPVVPTMNNVEVAALARYSYLLGFDFCAPWLDFSIIEMDTNDGRFPDISAFNGRLNENGLFATTTALGEFVRARRALQIKSNGALEDDDGCVVFRVQEVAQEAFAGTG